MSISITDLEVEHADKVIAAGVASSFSDAARQGLAYLALVVDRVGSSMMVKPER